MDDLIGSASVNAAHRDVDLRRHLGTVITLDARVGEVDLTIGQHQPGSAGFGFDVIIIAHGGGMAVTKRGIKTLPTGPKHADCDYDQEYPSLTEPDSDFRFDFMSFS